MQLSKIYSLSASCFVILSFLSSLNHSTVKAAALSELQNVNYRSEKICEKFCQTKTCFEESSFYSKIMNQKADPCENFYEYVCGNFTKNGNILDYETHKDAFMYIYNIAFREVFNEIRLPIQQNEPSAFKKLKTYYQNCMNTTHIEEEGTKPLFRVLEKIGGWPILLGNEWNEDSFDWVETFNKIMDTISEAYFPFVINIFTTVNSSNFSIIINPASTIFSDTYLLDEPDDKNFKACCDVILKVATELGANEDKILEEVNESCKFELNLHQIKTRELLNRNLKYNRMTIKKLSEKYSSIPWLKLINKIISKSCVSVTENKTIFVKNLKFFFKLEKLLKITSKRVQANFMVWRIVYEMLTYLPKKFQEIKSNYTNTISGTEQALRREEKCMLEIKDQLSVSLNAMYVRKYVNKDIKNNVTHLVQNIKNQTRKNLEMVDWMDEKTREAALEKLDAINVFVGYDDEWMDDDKINDYYKNLDINSGDYLESALNASSFKKNATFNKSSWTTRSSAVFFEATYWFQTNTIELTASLLRKPFFQHDRPQYLNYGRIGTIIGHEITHAFDNKGRKFDKNGKYKNWWQTKTEEKYLEKVQCIIDQYNNFTVSEVNLTINGVRTQNENIADNGGFKVAYHTYNEWAKRNNIEEECLPYMNYTPKQMFWISVASNWCNKESLENLRNFITTDLHSPHDARIILSFSNMKEFAEDFNCKPNSKMNPEKKCVVW